MVTPLASLVKASIHASSRLFWKLEPDAFSVALRSAFAVDPDADALSSSSPPQAPASSARGRMMSSSRLSTLATYGGQLTTQPPGGERQVNAGATLRDAPTSAAATPRDGPSDLAGRRRARRGRGRTTATTAPAPG